MKKIILLALGLWIVISVSAFSQDTMGNPSTSASGTMDKPMDKPMAKAPLMSLKGTVKQDGDKITFVNDKDSKSWDVINPETLKDHVGHHVKLSAHVYADKGSIHVMSVKMLKASSM